MCVDAYTSLYTYICTYKSYALLTQANAIT